MKLEDTISRSEDVVAREVGGETVLLDLEAGTYFGLNPIGGRIWQLLDGADQTLAAICDALEAEYDVAREVLEADVLELASDLEANGLVKLAAKA